MTFMLMVLKIQDILRNVPRSPEQTLMDRIPVTLVVSVLELQDFGKT